MYFQQKVRADFLVAWAERSERLLGQALAWLVLGRASHGIAVNELRKRGSVSIGAVRASRDAREQLENAVERLVATGRTEYMPAGLLARAAFRRSVGQWTDAIRDLAEAQEIAESGRMQLYLCDVELERVRVALACSTSSPPPLGAILGIRRTPATVGATELMAEATERLKTAERLVQECGYGRRLGEAKVLGSKLAKLTRNRASV